MAWAASWLAVRTGDPKYKEQAKALYDKHWKTEDGAGVWDNFGKRGYISGLCIVFESGSQAVLRARVVFGEVKQKG